MMKLDKMSEIILACDGQQEGAMVSGILSRWPYDRGTVRFVRVSANFVFTFQAAGKGYFLRINHASERTISSWQAEMVFIRALASTGLRVATPVASLTGNYVETAYTPCGELHAVVFNALPGKSYEKITDLSPERLIRWGKALGELHQAAQGYTVADGRPTWHDHLTFIADFLPQDDAAVWAVLQQVKGELESLPIFELNYGLIHYDFELDNIIWDGDSPGIIDFDGCAWYWFVADITFALRDLFDDRAELIDGDDEAFQAFMTGYRQARDIEDDELRLLPLFLRLHNLTTYAKLRRTLAAGKQLHEPLWMDNLREKLTRAMARYHTFLMQ